MKINTDHVLQRYHLSSAVQNSDFVDKLNMERENTAGTENEELKELSTKFTSIFLQQMFKAMRSTLPENKLFSGGFAEDVFTDMYDREVSEMGSKQQNFKQLSEILYRQLLEKQGNN